MNDVDSDLRDIHQLIILDHDARPRNYRALPDATQASEAYNPLCGDRYRIYLRIVGEVVETATFDGHGCAVSRASASIMTEMVTGLSRTMADAVAASAIRFLTSGAVDDPSGLGDLSALEGIHRIPSRQRCAVLAWTALQSALGSGEGR